MLRIRSKNLKIQMQNCLLINETSSMHLNQRSSHNAEWISRQHANEVTDENQTRSHHYNQTHKQYIVTSIDRQRGLIEKLSSN